MTLHVTLHADALRVLAGWQAPSAPQETLRQRYVAHLLAHDDGWSRDCSPDHLTASVLLLDADRERVLLTLHRKAGAWFQLGGHLEPGDATLAAAARREALEESGLPGADVHLDPEPLLLDAHAVPFCGGGATHLDVMFTGVAAQGASPARSAESLDLAWWPVGDLPNPELLPFVSRALDRARDRAQSTSSDS